MLLRSVVLKLRKTSSHGCFIAESVFKRVFAYRLNFDIANAWGYMLSLLRSWFYHEYESRNFTLALEESSLSEERGPSPAATASDPPAAREGERRIRRHELSSASDFRVIHIPGSIASIGECWGFAVREAAPSPCCFQRIAQGRDEALLLSRMQGLEHYVDEY
jgi:hypothetical protein